MWTKFPWAESLARPFCPLSGKPSIQVWAESFTVHTPKISRSTQEEHVLFQTQIWTFWMKDVVQQDIQYLELEDQSLQPGLLTFNFLHYSASPWPSNPALCPYTGDANSEGGEVAGAPLGGTSVAGSRPWLWIIFLRSPKSRKIQKWLSLGCFRIRSHPRSRRSFACVTLTSP